MSGPLGSSQWMYASGFEAEQSLRLDDGRASHLQFTPTSAGNRRTFTISAWIKRAIIQNGTILSGGADNNNAFRFRFNGAALQAYDYNGSSNQFDWLLETKADLRDPAAWMHVMLVVDTTQSTNTNRVKMYVNGTQQTDLETASYPTQNYDTEFNQADIVNRLGETHSEDSAMNGYLSEVYLLDGVVGTPADFGKTGAYGKWEPIEYSGSFGTNGWYLPFKQDYSVEGFNVVTYRGNGATKYVGGVGFEPNFVWIKSRETGSDSHQLYDTNRGIYNSLKSDSTDAESARTGTGLLDFTSDGFTLGNFQYNNRNTSPYVAWCWDMGNTFGLPVAITANGSVAHSTSRQKFGTSSIEIGGGSDYLTAPDESKFDFQGDFTVECWVSRDGNQIDNGAIISKYEVAGWILTTDVNEKILWWDQATGTQTLLTSTTVLDDNTWYHVAVVRKNDAFHLFINGTLEASKSYDYNYSISGMNTVLYVGRYSAANAGSFVGYVDDIRISNKARYETTGFTAPSSAFTNDENTILLISSNNSNGSTSFVDSSGAVQNDNGSTTSYVSANPTYGQSVVSYTGQSGAQTIGHGLSSTPEMIIAKNRSSVQEWLVYHHSLTDAKDKYLRLDTDGAVADNTFWNDTAPTNQVFSVGDSQPINSGHGNDYIAYCFHSVTGYSKFGSYTGNGSTTGPTVTLGFRPAFVLLKPSSADDHWNIYDTTRDPQNPINHILFPNRTNAEAAQQDIEISDTGFQLKTTNTGSNGNGTTYIYMAFADKREYAYWLDQSGNNNDWTSVALTESDISLDNPSNNFCTMNPHSGIGTFSEGNLKVVTTVAGSAPYKQMHYGTISVSSGKWYWEVVPTDVSGVLLLGSSSSQPTNNNQHNQAGSPGTNVYNENGDVDTGSTDRTDGAAYGVGDIIGVALDMDNDRIYFAANNTWANSGNPSTGSNSYPLSNSNNNEQAPIVSNDSTGSNVGVIFNFGQDSSFGSLKVSQGFQDSGGVGDFYFEPPSGFLALCTKNLPEPTVTPSQHFNTVLYTGTGSEQNVTGVGFQPDLTWIKERAESEQLVAVDVLRGSGVTEINPNSNAAESDDAQEVKAILSDGFQVGTSSVTNQNNAAHVAWNWKANGSGSSNSSGDITSTVSANTSSGFSIVTYTGNSSGGATFGHGLSKAPELVIIKGRNVSDNWVVWVNDSIRLLLNGVNANIGNNPISTSSTLVTTPSSVDNAWNGSYNYLAYCFHSVDGFSSIGTYTGNGSTDGTFVYTGFRPMWGLFKNTTDSNTSWILFDSKRSTFNPVDDSLSPDTGYAEEEDYDVDFVSNGFKFRTTSSWANLGGKTYIYVAFAETPFKYSNAR